MEQIPSWEANRFSSSQEITHILWNPKFHYFIYKCLPSVLNRARSIQSMHTQPILILSYHPRLGLTSGLCPSRFPTKTLYEPLLSNIALHVPSHLSLLDLIPRTLLGGEYRLLSSSLCNFLHSTLTSSLLGPNIVLSTLFSNTLILRSSLNMSDQDSHP